VTTHRMPEINEQPDEVQLETLLRGLLGRSEPRGALGPTVVLPEIAELRDTARLLRAASQWVPLPEGRLAVRRALMALAQQGLHHAIPRRAAWRRAGLWLSTVTALAAVMGAFGLGTGARDPLVRPSSPAHGGRLALNRTPEKRIPGHPGPGAYALTFEFSAVQVPSRPGTTARTTGKLGGLPATLSLTTASGCRAGAACGKFVVSVAGPATEARVKVGELTGTFACEAGGCILTTAQTTGAFARVSVSALSLNTTRPSVGQLGTDFSSFSEWASVVVAASDGLTTGAMSPGGGMASDPARQGRSNERRDHAQRGGTSQGKTARETKGAGGKRSGGTGKTGGPSKDTKDNVHSGTSTGPGAADPQRGHGVIKETDPSNAPGGVAVDHGQRDRGTARTTDHPGASGGAPAGGGGTSGGGDKGGGTGSAGGGSNRGGPTGSGAGGTSSGTRNGTSGAGGGTGAGEHEHETESGSGTGRN